MRFGKVLAGYCLILALYVVLLLMADKSKVFFEYGPVALAQLPVLMSLALLSYGLRYKRWYCLLKSRAFTVWMIGVLAWFCIDSYAGQNR